MIRLSLPLVLLAGLVAGCAGTQSQQAFVLQRPAVVVPLVETPNVSADHDRSLQAALDRSLRDQEQQDERVDLMAVASPASGLSPKEGPRCTLGVTESKLGVSEPQLAGLGP
ncbi:MAG TPA: hypothetical protein VEK07_22895 [Polyangiaceae bacterium]|nr:hypothetical protein [Polyangiaceae bacterium]